MAKECLVENCGRAVLSRGMCRAHYNRWARHGDPSIGGDLRAGNGAAYAWLVAQAYEATDDCVLWPFRRDKQGRGKIEIEGKQVIASRYMCRLVHGEPPTPKHHAAHSCGKGDWGCVNPRHLRWATPKENSADQKTHGTRMKGERYGRAKLTDTQAAEILSMKGTGAKQQALADRFGVHQSTISDIWSGKRRGWMKEANS